jgi:hypothetical protein
VPIPTLDPLWRPNATGPNPKTRDDRELIRSYSGQPAVERVLHDLTVTMNRMSSISPAAVAQVQTWINEIETLEGDWSGQVAEGTAHYAGASEYEGPLPGTTVERSDMLKRADVLEWDTDLKKVKYKLQQGTATQAGSMGQRIADLKGRVLTAMELNRSGGIVRS